MSARERESACVFGRECVSVHVRVIERVRACMAHLARRDVERGGRDGDVRVLEPQEQPLHGRLAPRRRHVPQRHQRLRSGSSFL